MKGQLICFGVLHTHKGPSFGTKVHENTNYGDLEGNSSGYELYTFRRCTKWSSFWIQKLTSNPSFFTSLLLQQKATKIITKLLNLHSQRIHSILGFGRSGDWLREAQG